MRTATLSGPRIEAELAMPGTDWMRLGSDGIRRPDLRVQMLTDDGETILLSYDIGVIRYACDRVAVMRYGELVESGPTEVVLSNPKHAYTRALLAALPGQRQVA